MKTRKGSTLTLATCTQRYIYKVTQHKPVMSHPYKWSKEIQKIQMYGKAIKWLCIYEFILHIWMLNSLHLNLKKLRWSDHLTSKEHPSHGWIYMLDVHMIKFCMDRHTYEYMFTIDIHKQIAWSKKGKRQRETRRLIDVQKDRLTFSQMDRLTNG